MLRVSRMRVQFLLCHPNHFSSARLRDYNATFDPSLRKNELKNENERRRTFLFAGA